VLGEDEDEEDEDDEEASGPGLEDSEGGNKTACALHALVSFAEKLLLLCSRAMVEAVGERR
jgi:hypothetical protein